MRIILQTWKNCIIWYPFKVPTTTPVGWHSSVFVNCLLHIVLNLRKSRFKYLCHQIRLQQHYFLYLILTKTCSQMKWKSGGKLLSNLFLLSSFWEGWGRELHYNFTSESSTGVGIVKILVELLHQSIVSWVCSHYSVKISLVGES